MRRNRASDGRLAAATCAMGTLTVNINNTAINLALPAIRDELRLDLVEMQWVSASYVLILAALTMIGGTLGDRFDKRQVLTVGLCLYTTGSLLGALSLSAHTLIGSRILAGIGAAVLVPVGLASLRQLASSPQQLTSYMSLWGLAVGLGMALGPVVGGGLTGYLGWRALFVAMTAFGVIYLFAVRICLPRLDSFERAGVSIVSHMLAAISMVSAAGLVIEMRSDSPWLLKASLAFALPVCGTLWIHRDRTTSHPVIPPLCLAKPQLCRRAGHRIHELCCPWSYRFSQFPVPAGCSPTPRSSRGFRLRPSRSCDSLGCHVGGCARDARRCTSSRSSCSDAPRLRTHSGRSRRCFPNSF